VQIGKRALACLLYAMDASRGTGEPGARMQACRRTRADLLMLMLLLAACGNPPPPEPAIAEAPGFTGSGACGNCHEAEFRAWRGSQHERAMQAAGDDTMLGDFSGIEFGYFDTKTRFDERDGSYFVVTENAAGKTEEFRVAYTFGVEPLQQYLVEFDGGRMQALPFAWDTRPPAAGGQRWFHLYPGEYIAPGDPLHWTGREHNWNFMCAECHSTNVAPGYDAQTDTFDTTYSEVSVGCEACHGPGSGHAAQAAAANFDERYGFAVDLDDRGSAAWVMNPDTGIAARSPAMQHAQQQPESCGRCHARRGIIAPNYDYGKPLADTHLPALLEEPLYFADGQIRDEVYVYGSFLQSRMYRAGVTCTNCHNPHSGELRTGANPNDVCAQCHLPAKFASTVHSRHDPDAASCVDCHMATRTYMVVDERRDHSFRIPRPDLSVDIGTPNACNGCHSDRDAAWAANAMREAFGSAALTRPHFGTSLAAGRAGHANEALRETAANPEFPPIARATALTLLQSPAAGDDVAVVQNALSDPDALVRIGALRALRIVAPETRLENGSALLADPVRGVRMEAVSTLAQFRDILPVDVNRQFTRTANEYRAAFETTANRPESLSALGTFDLTGGDLQSAVRYFGKALQLEPDFVPARLNLADALRQMQNETRAGDVLREGLARSPDDAALHHAYGLFLVRQSQAEGGLGELRRAVELEPANSRYTYVLGVALNSLGRQDEALALLRRVRADFPTDYDVGWALATILRDAGDIENALQTADELAAQFPDDAAVRALAESLR
jgi:predicted CXXCH cytochrome family protein